LVENRNWTQYNQALVKRGQVLLDLEFLKNWKNELKTLNTDKVGGRFLYPQSFMQLLAVLHAYILPYRQLEGFIAALAKHVEGLKAPDYTTIWWRVTKNPIKLDPQIDPNQQLTIAVDSSGIKVSNRGEWLRDKWKLRKGFIKIHLSVDTQSGQIISLEITNEKVGDNKKLKPLIRKATQKVPIAKVLGDGAYDSKATFRYLATQNITPVIKVRKNSSFHSRGCLVHKKAVVFQQDSNWKVQAGWAALDGGICFFMFEALLWGLYLRNQVGKHG
jgi:hypothetical protein